ncbi:CG18316 [Drosophila busckii]|uniref:CG18316 n=1 Tax=Drosophila busckii TaxID=30019 RepID=A0A0M4EQB5_DROBS|nr:CG18316 [Drosophila busckii]
MKPEKTHRKKASTVRRCPPRRIPKSVLTRTIEILDDSSDEFWLNKNSSCAPPINYEASLEEKHSDTYKKLNLARNCLLTRDWQNLAKLLTSNLFGSTVVQKCSIPIFSEVSVYHSHYLS